MEDKFNGYKAKKKNWSKLEKYLWLIIEQDRGFDGGFKLGLGNRISMSTKRRYTSCRINN